MRITTFFPTKSSAYRMLIPVFLLVLLMGSNTDPAPLRKYVTNQKLMLSGSIAASDEHGIQWDERLPLGWIWKKSSKKPNKYYMSLGQLTPEEKNGEIFFDISRWNFVNSALQDGFSEDFIIKKLKGIIKDRALRFKEDLTLTEARQKFEGLGQEQAEELFTEPKRYIDFSLSSKGIVVFQTTRRRLMKIFVENYSTSGYITAMEIPKGPEAKTTSKKQIFIKNLEYGWRADLDKDGLVDIIWNPISHIKSSGFEVQKGYRIALVEIFKK
ncbi:MAG: hypothetical protein KAX11_01925 [Candidatus Aminicenantes bacterium]|nr:hypothetical protein [Candidatus Aminicenantes bacterium]